MGEDGLARARLAGEDVQAGRQPQLGLLAEEQVLDAQLEEHARRSTSAVRRPASASAIGVEPDTRSNVARTVRGSSRHAARTAATSARGTDPNPRPEPTATIPEPASSVRPPGRTIVQSRSLPATAASARALASR